jgi:glycosyltransferase involved in cell wall biosynthesis
MGQNVARRDCRVALLLNYITRHQLPVFESLQSMVREMRVLVSVKMEGQRDYDAQFGTLDVAVQKNWMLHRKWKHAAGFEDNLSVHLPYDSLSQLRRYRPDVVVSFELGVRSILSSLYRKTHRRSRLILSLNVSEVTEQSWGISRRLIRPWLLRSADAVTYNGPSCRRYLRTVRPDQSNLFHFPYAANPDSIYSVSSDRDRDTRKKLLYVGQLTERKNPEIFLRQVIRWCSHHSTETIRFSIVGRGPLKERLASISLPKNLSLEWLGIVEPSNMPDVWAEHGILAFPTLADEWGMVVNEAMQSGLPVLGSQNAQSSETLIRTGENGWLFDPHDPNEIYRRIETALSTSHDELNRMASVAANDTCNRTPRYAAEGLYEAIQHVWPL